ncbi:MAG: ABC transporter permease [Bacteroidales bacterium]|nr:ABC transporter permease [Bacteroidales bacterium]
MFNYYIKLVFRNLLKNKTFSFINILGLTIGLTASMLIYLWVADELSYDKFHKDYDNIYRIYFTETSESPLTISNLPPALIPAVLNEIPEVEKGFRYDSYNSTIKYFDKIFKEKLFFVDQGMFDFMDFPFVKGSSEAAFENINSIVLTQKSASKYFGTENPIGKVLTIDGADDHTVTGIIQDIPSNSSIQPDFIIPINSLNQTGHELDNWTEWAWQSFVKLSETTNKSSVEKKINEILKNNIDNDNKTLYLQPVKNMHLYFLNGEPALLKSIYIFSFIAIIIILIACFNYMNLSTAKLISRAKNTAIQKVLGADRKRIIKQLLLESMLFSFLSLIFAFILVEFFRTPFGNLIERDLTIKYTDPVFILIIISVAIVAGLFAGIYPAIKLSSFKPILVLRGFSSLKSNKSNLRKVLVIVQFAVSVILISSTIIISRQMNYTLNKDLGIDHDNIVYFHVNDKLLNSYNVFKADLLESTDIKSITRTFQMPSFNKMSVDATWEGLPEESNVRMNISIGDYDYLKVFGLNLVDGRDFSENLSSDSVNTIINEEAVRQLQMINPVGTSATMWYESEIIGVLKNYHFMPLNTKIEPIAIVMDKGFYKICAVRINGKNVSKAIQYIETTFKKYVDDFPFDYHFMNDDYERMYKSEIQLKELYKFFSFLAIFIACLGLFGLSSFIAENKTKEIAIRKANGATVKSIVFLLNKEFLKWVFIAIFIAIPVAYLWMDKWLQSFIFHIDIGFFEFIIAGIIALLIAFSTIAFHAIRAANANPVESLRYE